MSEDRVEVHISRLHLVTDDAVLSAADFVTRARSVLEAHGEAVTLHLRGHRTSARALWALVEALGPAAQASGAGLLLNDRIDLALAARGVEAGVRAGSGVVGVQLGRRSLTVEAARRLLDPGAIVGYSTHAVDEARRAVAEGAHYLLAGTIYASASHPGEAEAGVEWLTELVQAVEAPVIAIGGITPARVAEVRTAGAHGAAVLSGVWAEDDAVKAVDRYLERMEVAV